MLRRFRCLHIFLHIQLRSDLSFLFFFLVYFSFGETVTSLGSFFKDQKIVTQCDVACRVALIGRKSAADCTNSAAYFITFE